MTATMGLTQLPPHDDNCGQPGQSCHGCSAMPASPVVVRLDDSVDWEQVAAWCGGELHTSSSVPGMDPESCIELRTAQGREETAGEGDWLIRGPHGEFWVVPAEAARFLLSSLVAGYFVATRSLEFTLGTDVLDTYSQADNFAYRIRHDVPDARVLAAIPAETIGAAA